MADCLSERIRELMAERGVTQNELSARTGITQSSISHYVNGDRIPVAESIVRLADGLGTSPDYLLHGEPFTEGEKLDDAAAMVTRCAGYLTREQKLKIVEAMIK